jgi:ketosteroid isomerase-like protein
MSEFRTPEEVLLHHGEAVEAADLDAIVADYSDDAVFITPQAVLRGKDGVRQGFTQLLGDLPQAEWQTALQIGGNVAFMQWSAVSARAVANDGVDTFVFRDGMICAQTICYTLETRR